MATKPAIVVISSHVARGCVGNRAAGFALEVMGYPVWMVPTVTLPWHPGHIPVAGAGRKIVPAQKDFTDLLNDLSSSPWIGEVGAILSGYLGNAEQAVAVGHFVEQIKQKNPNAIYAMDPVCGDNGRLYVAKTQADALVEHLVPRADIVTPNTFELSVITNTELGRSNQDSVEASKTLNGKAVLVTSSPGLKLNSIANLLVEGETAHLVEHPRLQGPPNGLGDLTSALFLGNLLDGLGPKDALVKTTSSVHECMALAARLQQDELVLEASLKSLISPRYPVESRILL
ncbi:MAG: pyridoxal kinase [Pseudomonadota bacterium]